MAEVEGIEKSMNVGTGTSSYKGVSDKDVRLKIGLAMRNNGLCILPVSISPNIRVDRWEETTNYGTKMKQSVFTEVESKYMLLHESGESIEVAGYGHGVDRQDKGAGKATTYALKNTLLSIFLVPTGTIEDTDKTHSDDIPVPQKKKLSLATDEQLKSIKELIKSRGRNEKTILEHYKIESMDKLSKVNAEALIINLNGLPEATIN